MSTRKHSGKTISSKMKRDNSSFLCRVETALAGLLPRHLSSEWDSSLATQLRRFGMTLFVVGVAFLLPSCGHDHPQKKAPEKGPLLLPVYGPKVAKAEGDTTYHTIGNFSFTNQYGENFSQKNTEGKIYIADFFFATCQNICPAMSTQLIRVQDAIKNDPDILIVS